MGLFGDIIRAFLQVFCGGNNQQQNEVPVQEYPQPQARPQVQQPQAVYQPEPYSHAGRPHQQQQQHQQPPHPHSPPPHHKPYVDQNQLNQSTPSYTALRAQANAEGDQMAKCFEESHEAYNRGDGALAKQLSEEGKRHKSEMERLNKQASHWIFVENNKDSQPGEIDLHGLYVKEAIEHADEAISEAKQRGDSEVILIVGKGLHSQSHVAKLKPAIEELMQKHQLVAELDPENSGRLIVSLQGGRGGRGLDSDEITRRLERKDADCIIM